MGIFYIGHLIKEAMEVANNARLAKEQATLDMQRVQTFFRENIGLIYRYVYSEMRNREETEDLTSQIFLKAVRGLNYEREAQGVRKWLFQVAHTTIADHWRAHYRVTNSSLEGLLEAGWEGPIEEDLFGVNGKSAERVQRILQALPQHYREVLTCRFLLSLSGRDTAIKNGYDGRKRQSIAVSRAQTGR